MSGGPVDDQPSLEVIIAHWLGGIADRVEREVADRVEREVGGRLYAETTELRQVAKSPPDRGGDVEPNGR